MFWYQTATWDNKAWIHGSRVFNSVTFYMGSCWEDLKYLQHTYCPKSNQTNRNICIDYNVLCSSQPYIISLKQSKIICWKITLIVFWMQTKFHECPFKLSDIAIIQNGQHFYLPILSAWHHQSHLFSGY